MWSIVIKLLENNKKPSLFLLAIPCFVLYPWKQTDNTTWGRAIWKQLASDHDWNPDHL
jgi:hypothetical protein